MLDNALIALLISTIVAGEATAGIPGTPIKQAFQPTAQGANSQPTAYLYKIGDRRRGFVSYSDVWDANTNQMVHTESQIYETTFQISALSAQNPATPTQYTASDILNLIASILQSSAAIAAFEAHGVGIERIMDLRNSYFLDDAQRNEAAPSMDVVFSHSQTIASTSPVVSQWDYQILPI